MQPWRGNSISPYSEAIFKMWWIFCLSFLEMVKIASSEECQYTLKEPKGVIATPNFPHPYKVPINCQWIIQAPADKVVAVYFTQFYMREGLRATEYAYFSQKVKMDKYEFGPISSEREPTYLVSNKPVLVLDFAVTELANIHMRVREYLLDVFGFNITYEFIARNESVRKDACLYHHCSFTGNCYASLEMDTYYCSCFAKNFGDECQYDSDCGPTASRNMCQNGGTCRYYIGSSVRTCECPPGYDGARCESRKISVTNHSGCPGPGCNDTCTSDFPEILDPNCPKKENLVRYITLLKLTNPRVNTILNDRRKMETFKKDMENALYLLFKDRLEVLQNITVIDVRPDAVMKFHLLSTKNDEEELKLTIEQMLQVGKLGVFDFDQDYQEYESEPALRIDRIESSEKMPVVESTELTLACMVQGSKDLHVEWFKDGHPVHVHETKRGMWSTIVPKNSQEQYTALLGFDRVASLDSGIFTCRATDWGFTQNRSIHVYVLSAPQPQLTPMTATVYEGTPVVITCLSQDDIYASFGYTWLKEGKILNPSIEPEMPEDLFPSGSRILLPEATSSAIYSCIITSPSGSTKKDSSITVIKSHELPPLCQAEDYLKVRWTLTASNTENVQLCPAGYKGDVRRQCVLSSNGQTAFWDEPDFSGCFSSGFLGIKRKVDSIKLGYISSDAASLMYRLKRFLIAKKLKMHYSEGEPVVDVLQDIQSINYKDKRSQETWPIFLDISSVLLESPILVRKQSKIFLLHELINTYGMQYAEKLKNGTFEMFQRNIFAIEVGKFAMNHTLRLPTQKMSGAMHFSEDSAKDYTWMFNSIEINTTHYFLEDKNGNSTDTVVAIFYKNLSTHLPQRIFTKKGIADIEYKLISNLVGVNIRGVYEETTKMSVKVTLAHFNRSFTGAGIGWNISCAMADFTEDSIRFSTEKCHLIWTSRNMSLCQCDRLATYALLLAHYVLPEEADIPTGFDAIAGSGCAICAFFVLVTFLVLVSWWRKIRGAIIALEIQVCIALLGAFGIFFCGTDKSLSEEFYPYTTSLIQFFLLTTFSLQLCLALAVYIESIDLKNLQYSFVKIAALGWAIPVIIVGATLTAQSLEGFSLEKWWLTIGSNFFYAYTSSILILTMLQILLILIVKSEIRNHKKFTDFLHNKKIQIKNNRIRILYRSLLLTIVLLFLSVASILYVNYEEKMYEYFFAVTSSIVGLIVFFSYTCCNNKLFSSCLQESHDEDKEIEELESRSGTDSFKSFLKPEIVDDPYSRKMHLDSEKRNERIKRMYTQIEKASLSDTLNPHRPDATTELLMQAHFPTPESFNDDGHTPIFKTYRHPGVTNGSPHHLQDRDAFCDTLDKGDGYPRMHWRYANHPHIMFDSPKSGEDSVLPSGAKRPLLLQSDVDHQHGREVYGEYPSSFSTPSTFQPCQTVKVDVVSTIPVAGIQYPDTYGPMDNLDDGCSLKSSCFLQHTDSLETVVHCEASSKSTTEAPVTCDVKSLPTQSWNMTTV